MTDNFSMNRLLQLIRKQWIENRRWYLYSSLAITGLLSLVFTFWVFSSNGHYTEDVIYVFFMIGLFLSGAIFASVSFSSLGDKARATYWLGFPASHLEKLLCHIFYSVIVFTVVYFLCFFAVKSLTMLYIHDMVARYPDEYKFQPLRNKEEFWNMYELVIYGYFAVQAFYLLGSVYFPKLSFIITSAVGAALIIVFIIFLINLDKGFFASQGYSWNVFYVDHYLDKGDQPMTIHRYQLSSFWQQTLTLALKFAWAPIFWIAAWFRLKEKQV